MRWLPQIAATPESWFLPSGAGNRTGVGQCGRNSDSKEVTRSLCHDGVKWVSFIRKFLLGMIAKSHPRIDFAWAPEGNLAKMPLCV